MRSPSTLPLLALLASLPATSFGAPAWRLGESWVWEGLYRETGHSLLRSVTVRSSTTVPEGIVWTLDIRDSVSGAQDSALWFAPTRGDAVWLRRSTLLEVDLQPRPARDTTWSILGFQSVLWGMPSGISKGVSWWYTPTEIKTSLQMRPGIEATTSYPFPRGIWSDSHGMERYLNYTTTPDLDWKLLQHDGRPVAIPDPVVALPSPGSRMVWEVFSQEETRAAEDPGDEIPAPTKSRSANRLEVEWTIDRHLSDSAGWRRVSGTEVRKSMCQVGEAWRGSQVVLRDTICPLQEKETSELSIRIQPRAGLVVVAGSTHPFATVWRSVWEDSLPVSDSSTRRDHWQGQGGFQQTCEGENVLLVAGGLYDSSSRISSCVAEVVPRQETIQFTTIRLLRVDDRVLRPSLVYFVGNSPAANRRDARSWRQLAAAYPDLPVRWTTASGRGGVGKVEELNRFPASLRGQILFLQARLPDGHHWQGVLAMP